MTGYVFAAVLLLSPPLQAVFDLPLQLAFQQAVLLACLASLLLGLRRGELPPGFGARRLYPLWAAAALSFAALLASPLRGLIFNEWGNYAAGLLIFLFSSAFNKEERARADAAFLASAWAIFGLALLQAFALRNFAARPPLTNLNALALYAVMLVPPALERRRWFLAGAMVVLVIWTQSVGAALAGLTAAGAYAASRFRKAELRENALPLAALALVAAGALYLLQADSMAGRLAWWRGAWSMFLARPLAGFGHAGYTWAQAAFQPAGAFREHSVYAHDYYLEFLAENGLPAALAWFWLLFSAVRRRSGLAKFSLIAALAHSLVDFGLSVPANFWLFCYLLAEPAGGEPPARAPAALFRPALLLAALLEAALLSLSWRSLAFERAQRRALAAFAAGDPALAEEVLRPALASPLLRGPALEFLGRLNLTGRDAGFRAAVYFEEALLRDRYSAAAWSALRRVYSVPGRQEQAAGLERRRREVFR